MTITKAQAQVATLEQLTDELAAAGWDSTQNTQAEALDAVLALIGETQGTVRFSEDGSVSMVWEDGKPVRCPTQHDMDSLPVGPDMTDEELDQIEAE